MFAAAAQGAATENRNRVVRFADLPKWAQSDIPRDVRDNARIVGVLGDRTIVVAPTSNGNYCVAYVGKRHNRGWGGCRVRTPSPRSGGNVRDYLLGATTTWDGRTIRTVSGDTLAGPDVFVSIVYADGTREPLTMIWVGAPIRAGFFYRTIRKPHQVDSRRPTAVELRARDGRLVARDVIHKPRFRR